MDVRTFLMMGRHGAGKGTQAKLLAEKIGGQIYSSGDKCREFAAQNSFFGHKTKKVVDSGDLMPEWFSMYLFEDILIQLEPQDAIVFEGTGRKLLEAQRFHEIAGWLTRPYLVVNLVAPEESLRKRLLERHALQGRADDVVQAIGLRFKRFTEYTVPAIEFFRQQGKVIDINAEGSVEDCRQQVFTALKLS